MRWRAALVVLAVIVPTLSASAATVGLGGGDSDPQLITDPTYQMLAEGHCLGFFVAPYRCALYDATPFALSGGITSIDFRLLDENENQIPVSGDITADPLSALQTLTVSPINDGITFRLSSTTPLVCFTCIFFSFPDGDEFDPRWVSIVNVTGVPEPSTLLLLGPAAALALRRRFRTTLSRGSAVITWRPWQARSARNVDR
jgi:PEP-CTERM motif